jgi:hypothetical protein
LSIILLLGPLVELKFGWQKFTLMVVSTAILTAILHTLLWDNGLIGARSVTKIHGYFIGTVSSL